MPCPASLSSSRRRPTVSWTGTADRIASRWAWPPLRWLPERLAYHSHSEYIGQALLDYLGRGILLADVHRNNIGQVYRDGRDLEEPDHPAEGELISVITDPGHAVFLDDAYDAVTDLRTAPPLWPVLAHGDPATDRGVA